MQVVVDRIPGLKGETGGTRRALLEEGTRIRNGHSAFRQRFVADEGAQVNHPGAFRAAGMLGGGEARRERSGGSGEFGLADFGLGEKGAHLCCLGPLLVYEFLLASAVIGAEEKGNDLFVAGSAEFEFEDPGKDHLTEARAYFKRILLHRNLLELLVLWR